MNAYLIGLAGPSCSGKSEVARRLARILRAPIVPLDHYYRDLVHLPLEERAQFNFDAPDALDAPLILEHARCLRQGRDIGKPKYDFAHHTRAEGVETIRAAPYVILEGLFALHWPELLEMLDCRVYITAEHEVCLARRIHRDMRERGRTEASVRAQFEATVRPMCDQWVAPSMSRADIVLRGTDPVKQSVLSIVMWISERAIESMGLA